MNRFIGNLSSIVVETDKLKDALQFLIRAEWYWQLPNKIKRRAQGKLSAHRNLQDREVATPCTLEFACKCMGNPGFATPKHLCSYADKIIPKVKQHSHFENSGLFVTRCIF
jgi:hypothetical protein